MHRESDQRSPRSPREDDETAPPGAEEQRVPEAPADDGNDVPPLGGGA
jgi:hypothetical protein